MVTYQPIFRLGVVVCLSLLLVRPSGAQEQDTTRVPSADSLQETPQSGPPGQQSSEGAPSGNAVQFSAQDSLVIVTDTAEGDQGTLHGEAEMSYQDASLRAKTIEMEFETSQLEAYGSPSDTATSRPTFQQGQQQSFTGERLAYNLETERGRVVEARTQQREGFVQGQAVKVFEDSTLFVQDGSYTTCDCPPDETPSYSLRSNQMKIDGRWVYTGPIHMYLFNIPTPLWLPFGFLPNVEGRRSGPLPPNYGQNRRKGLFLKDWGWYFALNDYMDLQLRASVWSQGSFEINPIFRYAKRYEYNGNFNLRYQRERIGEEEDPNFQNRHSGQLRWQHSQDLNPTSSLRGNINLTTSSDFAQRNSENYNDAVSQDISSSLRYSKKWPGGGQNLSISANQQQELQSGGNVSVTLPSLDFSQRSFKPFEREQSFGDERWYEKITTSYNFSARNQFSYDPRDPNQLRQAGDSTLADSLEQADIDWYEALVDRNKYQLATGNDDPFDLEAEHSIPLSASFRVNRYNLNFSPRINYNSNWHISTERLSVRRDSVVAENDSLVIEEREIQRTEPGFYARHDFSTSLSTNTELYGLFPVVVGPFEGLRHRMSPSLSLSYQPNFNDPFWGRTRPLRYQNGDPVIDQQTGEPVRYDILNGQTVRGSNEQRNLSFSLNNELETKHVRTDSTGERQENKIKLLDFDLGTSYNFAADSLRLSDVRLNARTTIERFSIRSSMTFSPYALERRSTTGEGVRYGVVDRYMAAESPLTPLRLTRFRLSLSGSVQSAASQGSGQSLAGGRRQTGASPQSGQSGRAPGSQQGSRPARAQNASQYADFSLPWSLSFDFSYSFRKPAKEIENQNATLNADFDLNVTPLWSVNGRTGYDFIQNKLATTRIGVNRDLGCWVMSFSWVPFGRHQQYSFNLRVKSGQLSQLLQLQIPNSGSDSRLGGFGDQLRGTVGGLSGGGGPGRGGF